MVTKKSNKISAKQAALNKLKKEIEKNTPVTSSYQIDNLLRFLNHVNLPQDIISILNLSKTKKYTKIADDIINFKQEMGSYIKLSDLQKLPSLDVKTLQIMLDNSKYQIINPISYSMINRSLKAAFLDFLNGNIFFAINFIHLPKDWTKKGDLLMLWELKTGILEE